MSISRDIDVTMLAALDDPTVTPVLLCKIELDGLTIAWHTDYGDIVYDSVTYEGGSNLGDFADLDESGEMTPAELTFQVSGISDDMRSIALTNTIMNRPATVYLGALKAAATSASDRLIGTPMIWFQGRLKGGAQIEIGNTSAIQMTIVNRVVDWERPLNVRYNDATLQAAYPGDLGLQYMESVANSVIAWPGAHYWKHQ